MEEEESILAKERVEYSSEPTMQIEEAGMVRERYEDKESQKDSTLYRGYLFAIVTSLLCSGAYGFNLSVVNQTLPGIQKWLEGEKGFEKISNVAWAFIVSVYIAGSGISTLYFIVTGGGKGNRAQEREKTRKEERKSEVAQRESKRDQKAKTSVQQYLFNGDLLNACGGILFAMSPKLASNTDWMVALMMIARVLQGMGAGIFLSIVPVLLTSTSTKDAERGRIASLHQIGIVLGISSAFILGMNQVLGAHNLWQWCYLMTAFGSLVHVFFLGMFEKPTCLGNANSSDRENISKDNSSPDSPSEEKKKLKDLFLKKELRLPCLLTVCSHLFQQLSGINGIMYYSTYIFHNADNGNDISVDDASLASCYVGITSLLSTFVCLGLIDKVGRKVLMCVSLFGCSAALVVLVISMCKELSWYLSVGSTLVFVAMFNTGTGSIPWIIPAEMFSEDYAVLGGSLGICVNLATNFAVASSFVEQQAAFGCLLFAPYAVCCFIGGVFTLLYMRETNAQKRKAIEVRLSSMTALTTWDELSESFQGAESLDDGTNKK
eukprot:Nk52_evm45s226 gene=Nk52_evmTU45s226